MAKTFNFETALSALGTIVTELEKGDGHLETSLKKFEEGIRLTRQCQQALKDAQQKVTILLEQSKDGDLVDFYATPEGDVDPDGNE